MRRGRRMEGSWRDRGEKIKALGGERGKGGRGREIDSDMGGKEKILKEESNEKGKKGFNN